MVRVWVVIYDRRSNSISVVSFQKGLLVSLLYAVDSAFHAGASHTRLPCHSKYMIKP